MQKKKEVYMETLTKLLGSYVKSFSWWQLAG